MWRLWHLFDVRRALIGLHVGLALLAFTIHVILLSTDRYNWLNGTVWTSAAIETSETLERLS